MNIISMELPLHTHFNTPDKNKRVYDEESFFEAFKVAKDKYNDIGIFGGVPIIDSNKCFHTSEWLPELSSIFGVCKSIDINYIAHVDLDYDNNITKKILLNDIMENNPYPLSLGAICLSKGPIRKTTKEPVKVIYTNKDLIEDDQIVYPISKILAFDIIIDSTPEERNKKNWHPTPVYELFSQETINNEKENL